MNRRNWFHLAFGAVFARWFRLKSTLDCINEGINPEWDGRVRMVDYAGRKFIKSGEPLFWLNDSRYPFKVVSSVEEHPRPCGRQTPAPFPAFPQTRNLASGSSVDDT